jgi:small-conductance mechanosensitive channel
MLWLGFSLVLGRGGRDVFEGFAEGCLTFKPQHLQLRGTPIRRFIAHAARRVEVQVGISYRSDINQAIEVIKGALNAHLLVPAEPKLIVFIDRFDDSSVALNVFAWAPVAHFFDVRQALPRIVKETLDTNGIEIPFPQRVVHVVTKKDTDSGETPYSRRQVTGLDTK